MFPRFPTFLALTLSFALAGCSTPLATSGTDSGKSPHLTDLKGLFPVLEKGMSAEVVRKDLGAPAEIQPMASPDGHAEVWVYHFEKNVGMTQVSTGTRDIPTFSTGMSGPGTTTVQQQTYSMATKKSVVTLSLLMFNGQLAAQKAMVEDRLEY